MITQAMADARAGRRVVFVAESQRLAVHAFRLACDQLTPEDAPTVRASSGRERIAFPSSGGWLVFGSVASETWRGWTADVVYLDADAMPRQLATIVMMVVATRGQVVHR